MRCHFFSTSAGFADLVVFISAFMAVDLFRMRKAAPMGAAVGRANREEPPESQENPPVTEEVKSYLSFTTNGSVTIGTGRGPRLL
jgi:hypothetical protein